MTNEEILANAPEHWLMRRIVELEKEVERLCAHNLVIDAASALNDDLKQKLKAAERERDDMKANIDHLMKDCHRFTDKRLNEFTIEQQIKALENAIQENSFDNEDINAEVIYVDDLRVDIEQLRQQLRKGKDDEK